MDNRIQKYVDALNNNPLHIGGICPGKIADCLEELACKNEELAAQCVSLMRECDNLRAVYFSPTNTPCRVSVILKNGERIAIDLEKATVNSDKSTGKITGYEFQGIKGAYPLYIDVADISAVVAEQRPVLGGSEATNEEAPDEESAG